MTLPILLSDVFSFQTYSVNYNSFPPSALPYEQKLCKRVKIITLHNNNRNLSIHLLTVLYFNATQRSIYFGLIHSTFQPLFYVFSYTAEARDSLAARVSTVIWFHQPGIFAKEMNTELSLEELTELSLCAVPRNSAQNLFLWPFYPSHKPCCTV